MSGYRGWTEPVETYLAQVSAVCQLAGLSEDEWRGQYIAEAVSAAFPRHERLVYAGCGPLGNRFEIESLVAAYHRVDAVDLSPVMLAAVPRHPQIHRVQGDVQRLPFPNAYADTALCVGVLHELTDVVLAFAELHRVVRPGGTVIVVNKGIAPHVRTTPVAAYLAEADPNFVREVPIDAVPEQAIMMRFSYLQPAWFWKLEWVVGW